MQKAPNGLELGDWMMDLGSLPAQAFYDSMIFFCYQQAASDSTFIPSTCGCTVYQLALQDPTACSESIISPFLHSRPLLTASRTALSPLHTACHYHGIGEPSACHHVQQRFPSFPERKTQMIFNEYCKLL